MLKPWREIAVPHEDVLKGTFQQAEFAADLSRVHNRTATAEYQDPALFFQRTFITEGMRLLLDSVVKRLTQHGGDPVIQLQTAFGGGKTHTMLAVYHLAKGETPTSELQGIPQVLDAAGITELPRANLTLLDGNNLAPNMPVKRGKATIHTLWGELAWQLGGEAAYSQIRDADVSGTSPGKEVLVRLLSANAPCIILMDELVAYVRQFDEGKSYTGGTYDSNLSFIQALTEALKAVPTAMLLASLPESDKEAGSQRGIGALRTLEHYFARVQALWKPVAAEEAFEIVRRRLFSSMIDKRDAEDVCRAYADFYVANSTDFPHETQDRYFERLVNAYPIHPEVFDRLYEDWSSLDSFQRTRGVLKLMAKVIYRLWKDGNNDLLIMPGSLPLYDADTRNEAICYLPQGWDPVLERDIDGERAETSEIESRDTRLGTVQACRRAARTIFLGSAPTTPNQMVRGLEAERVLLGCVQPGQQVGLYKDALRRLTDRLHYLNSANSRFWFDTRPNLRREMEERKRRFNDKDDVFPAIRERLQKTVAHDLFSGIHIFTASSDVPDDWALRLVILAPDAPHSKARQSLALNRAADILKNRGEQPRQKQNRLVFLCAEQDTVNRLRDQVKSMLAWQSIVKDYEENKIVLDNLMAKNAETALSQARDALQRMIREAYKWLVAPMQEGYPGKVSEIQWEALQVNPGAQNLVRDIERVLTENELLITEWAPIHLVKLLKVWFWKEDVKEVGALDVWQKMCQYLYLPRLKDDRVFVATVANGANSRDFFGLAYGKEGDKYLGFSFGKPFIAMLDSSLLLIEPATALSCDEKERAADEVAKPKPGGERTYPFPEGSAGGVSDSESDKAKGGRTPCTQKMKRRFYGTIELDPVLAKKQFADIVDEVVLQFTSRPDVDVTISVEIRARTQGSFDEGIQRAVKENANVLRFKNTEFEDGV